MKKMKQHNSLKTKPTMIHTCVFALMGVFGFGVSSASLAVTCSASGVTYTCTGISGEASYDMTGNGLPFNNYEHIKIDMTGNSGFGGVGPRGFGIYFNNKTVNLTSDLIEISTNGDGADGLRFNGNNTIEITGKLIINANGSSGDGINASNSNNSGTLINISSSDAYIESNGGIGLRANITANGRGNTILVGSNATVITHGNGSNTSAGLGYAVYAGNRDRDTANLPFVGSAKVQIEDGSIIQTSGNDAYAIYANKTGQIQLGSTTITTTGTNAHGIVVLDGSVGKCTGNSLQQAFCLAGISAPTETQNYDGGQVYLTGDTTVTVDTTKGSYAMYASGTDSLITSGYMGGSTASGEFNITGDLVADNAGKIDLTTTSGSVFASNVKSDAATVNLNGIANYTGNFEAVNNGVVNVSGAPVIVGDFTADTGGRINLVGTNNTSFKGITDTSSGAGVVNVSLAGANSRWDVTGVSTLTDLNLNSGARVVFGDWTSAPENANRVILTMDTLSGTGGSFYIGTNLHRDTKAATIDVNDADMIRITGASSGTHSLFVYDDRTGGHVPGEMPVRVVEADQRGAAFVLGGSGYINVGHLEYDLVEEATLAGGVQGAGHWALAPTSRLNNFAQNSVGLLNTNYLLSYTEAQTLLQRMGELRTPGNRGDAWGRIYTGKLSSFDDDRIGGSDFDYHGMQFGVDRQFEHIGNGRAYVGAVVGYTKGDTSYEVGSGKTEGYHVGVYGTYMMDNGFYIDGLLKYQHLKNSVSSFTGGGFAVDGSDSSSGVSLGLEVGKRFYIQQPQQGWYVEPQGQLTYTSQGSTTIEGSNGLRTDLSSYKSVLGRVSIIAGYEIVDGVNPVNVYVKTGYVKEFDGDASYTFNHAVRESYDFGGGWWDNGVGVNMRINNQHNIYAEAGYARGGSFDKKQLNLGYRYEF